MGFLIMTLLHSKFTSPAVLRTLLVLVIASCVAADLQRTWMDARNAVDKRISQWEEDGYPNGVTRFSPRMADGGPHGWRMCHLLGGRCHPYKHTGIDLGKDGPATWTDYHCLEQDYEFYHGRVNGGFNLKKATKHFGVKALEARGPRLVIDPVTYKYVSDPTSELVTFEQLLKECAT